MKEEEAEEEGVTEEAPLGEEEEGSKEVAVAAAVDSEVAKK